MPKTLQDFLLAVSATAFKSLEQEGAFALLESEFGVTPNREFWRKYRWNKGFAPYLIEAPTASFRLPPTLRVEFIIAVASQSIVARYTTGFHAATDQLREVMFQEAVGYIPRHEAYPLLGYLQTPIALIRDEPARAAKSMFKRLTAALAYNLDNGVLSAPGTGAPLGILKFPGLKIVERGLNVGENMARMREAFHAEATTEHQWLASTAISFWGLKDHVAKEAITFTDILPTLLSRCCLMLVDLKRYGIALRWDEMEVGAGVAAYDQVGLFFGLCGDGGPIGDWCDDREWSPFVGLGEERI